MTVEAVASMGKVRARATVDATATGYAVRVWGEPPYDCERTYAIRERSEDYAALEGLRLFEAEMTRAAQGI